MKIITLPEKLKESPEVWLRLVIILAVLGFSALAFALVDHISWKILLVGIGAIIGAFFALRNMPLALTIVLLVSAPSGITIDTGTSTPIALGMVAIAGLTAVWFMKMLVLDRHLYLKPSPLNLPLLAFLIMLLISWIAGEVLWSWRVVVEKPGLMVQIGQYALFALSFAAMFLTAHQALKEKDIQRWTWIVIFLGLGEMTFELLSGSTRLRQAGITGALYTFPVVLLGAQILFNPRLDKRLYLTGVGALLIFTQWAYSNRVWKGGWVPAVIGLGLLLLLKDWRWFLLVVIGAVTFSIIQWDWVYQQFIVSEQNTMSTVRSLFWWDVIRMTSISPWLGLGLVNYMAYWYDPTFTPLSRLEAGWMTWEYWGYSPPSHNMFVDIYAQSGLIGLSLFLWGMVAAVWVMVKTVRYFKPGFTNAYVLGVLCGFIAMLINSFLFADWLIPFVYNITITGFAHSVYSWILIGSVLGLYLNQAGQQKHVGTDEPVT